MGMWFRMTCSKQVDWWTYLLYIVIYYFLIMVIIQVNGCINNTSELKCVVFLVEIQHH